MLTDPIADMLTRVRNANMALHDQADMPTSKMKVSLAAVLQQEGYIAGYEVNDRTLTVKLSTTASAAASSRDQARLQAWPRVYIGHEEIPACSAGWASRSSPPPRESSPGRGPSPRSRWRADLHGVVRKRTSR